MRIGQPPPHLPVPARRARLQTRPGSATLCSVAGAGEGNRQCSMYPAIPTAVCRASFWCPNQSWTSSNGRTSAVLSDLRTLAHLRCLQEQHASPHALRAGRRSARMVRRSHARGRPQTQPMERASPTFSARARRPAAKPSPARTWKARITPDGSTGPSMDYALEAARAISEDPATRHLGVDVVVFCDEEGHFRFLGSSLGHRPARGEQDGADAIPIERRALRIREAVKAAGWSGRQRHLIEPAARRLRGAYRERRRA